LTLLVWSFDPSKRDPDMTYNVFGGTFKPCSIYLVLRWKADSFKLLEANY